MQQVEFSEWVFICVVKVARCLRSRIRHRSSRCMCMKMSHCLTKLYVAQVCGDLLGKPRYRLMSRSFQVVPELTVNVSLYYQVYGQDALGKFAKKAQPWCITECIWLNQLHANIHKTCHWYCPIHARAISMPLLALHESMWKVIVGFSFMYKAVCLLYDLFCIETDTII